MHLTPQTLAAVASSPWIIPNPLLHTGTIGLGVTFTSNANLTCEVQHTFDDPSQNYRAVTYTRVTTTLTITDNNHGLNVGDNVILAADANGTVNASYDIVSITDQNTYTVTVTNSGAASGSTTLQSYRVFNHDTLTTALLTGTPPPRTAGNYADPIGAFRLKVTVYTAGSVTLSAQQGLGN